jgi:hypothetical protein
MGTNIRSQSSRGLNHELRDGAGAEADSGVTDDDWEVESFAMQSIYHTPAHG